MSAAISFFVPGEPKAQPRARSFVLRGRGGKPIMKNGQPIIRVHEAGTAEHWKSQIAQAAKEFVPTPPLQGPLRMDIDFIFPRPKAHLSSKGIVKTGAPKWHTKKPDRDNCEKAVTDALKTLGMFSDDCQICAGEVSKVYTDPWGTVGSGAQITIVPLEQPRPAPAREEKQPQLISCEDDCAPD